jgi:hypothetical protein
LIFFFLNTKYTTEGWYVPESISCSEDDDLSDNESDGDESDGDLDEEEWLGIVQ